MSTPDYRKWLTHSQWTLIQAAALAAETEPAATDSPHEQLAVIEDRALRDRFNDVYRELKSAIRSESAREREGFTDVEPSRTGPDGNKRVLPSEFLDWARRRGFELPNRLRDVPPVAHRSVTRTEQHVSDKLAILNQAARKFWGSTDVVRERRETHPDNDAVATWLMKMDRGFTKTLADKAATIIRPTWAATGRKPTK